MKKMLLTGIALGLGVAFASAAQRADQDRRRRPDHRPERRLRGPAPERRRAGRRGHQRGRRRHRPEASSSRSATTSPIRSRASRSPTSSPPRASSWSSATSTPASRSRPRTSTGSRHHPDHAGLDEPAVHRARPCGTPSAPAAATTSRARSPASYLAKNFKGKKVAVVHDKTPYGKGLADETQKAMNARRREGGHLRGHQHRREGLLGPRLQAEGRRTSTSSISAACTPRPA